MIGYYVHHHGQGHLSRAACVAAAADEPVVAVSSLPEPATHPFADWIVLPADPAITTPLDASADGSLHWAPLNSPGYRDRMALLAEWVTTVCPRLVVVDVSVEVTALLRLLAVPVVVVACPGSRHDDAHRLGRRLAGHLIAPWPQLGSSARPGLTFTGAFSRFDGRPVEPSPGRGRVLVLLGTGGTDLPPGAVHDAAEATPAWTWRTVGGNDRWAENVWDELMAADVVVTHAGLGALAEVAVARRPAVVVPQERPFGEQHATARRLRLAGLAEVVDSWPAASRWPSVLDAALSGGGALWSQWNDGGGAARFVAALDPARPAVSVV